MKNYTAFFVIAFLSIAVYYVFSQLGVDDKIASGAASLPLLALPQIYEEMQRRKSQKDELREGVLAANIDSLEGFSIPWMMMVLYGAAVIFGVTNGAVLLSAVVLGILSSSDQQAMPTPPTEEAPFPDLNAMGLLSLPYMIIGVCFVGYWIGSRCSKQGLSAVITACFVSIVSSKVIDYLLLDEETLLRFLGAKKEIWPYAGKVLPASFFAFMLFVVIGLVGYWRGRKKRLAKYMQYLLSVLPRYTRETLVNLAFEEAQMLASQQRTSATASSSPGLATASQDRLQ